MFVAMLVLLALVAGDKLVYLNFLDAEFCYTDYDRRQLWICYQDCIMEVFQP